MQWPAQNNVVAKYWLRVYAGYALAEAGIQLIFYFILNNFGNRPISNIPFHIIMWVAQCLLICPIWYVAFVSIRLSVGWQVIINTIFFLLYSLLWFGPVQTAIIFAYEPLQQWMLPPEKQLIAYVDSLEDTNYAPYQVLKHTFRLGWFYLAYFHFSFQKEEAKKLELATANQALQLNLLKWQLNASFYEKTLEYLQKLARQNVKACARPILQLSKLMEYVIYDARAQRLPLAREADFLQHYIELVNQQSGMAIKWKLERYGHCEKATIAPLLLAEIMDNLGSIVSLGNSTTILLKLTSESGEIVFTACHPAFRTVKIDLSTKTGLYNKLQKMYRNKFKTNQDLDRANFQFIFPLQPIEYNVLNSPKMEVQ